jgi:hypothetical protein
MTVSVSVSAIAIANNRRMEARIQASPILGWTIRQYRLRTAKVNGRGVV